MATYTAVDPNLTGAVPALTAVASADKFLNNGHMLLHVHNGSVSSVDVTIDDPRSTSPSGAVSFNPDVTVAVAAGADKYIGPFDPNRFNDANGFVNIAYSAITTITAEVIDAA